jgi:hypothetical protein
MRALLDPKDQARLIHRSGGPSNRTPKEKRERECDFYTNPTLMSRLILHQKYAAAVRRLQQYPTEAAVWVCVKRQRSTKSKDAATGNGSNNDGGKEYTMRQLPLHMACQDLARVGIEASNRAPLEELIAHLILAYPTACARQDHSGSWPLHEAIWYTAKPETISHLLCGAPGIANSNDQYGRSCIYLNRHCRSRTPEDQAHVQVMLQRGVAFWETAFQEANLRLRHRTVPADNASIDSTSVLAPGTRCGAAFDEEDQSTIVTNDASRATKDHAVDAQTLAPWSWSQLEERAQRLEHLLAESLEKFFKVSVAMSQLETTHSDLQEKYRLLAAPAADPGNEQLVRLEQENARLERENQQLQNLVQRNNLSFDDGRTGNSSKPTKASVRHEIPKDIADAGMVQSLKEDRRKLQIEVDELTRRNKDYERRVGYFERVFDTVSKSHESEDSGTITSVATGLEHLAVSEPVGRDAGAGNGGSGIDDLNYILNGAEQLNGHAWKSAPRHLLPSYDGLSSTAETLSQENDQHTASDVTYGTLLNDQHTASDVTFGTLLNETFRVYKDSQPISGPVGSVENMASEAVLESADSKKSFEDGLNDLFMEAAAALYDSGTDETEEDEVV